jgi:hypothetical protein
LGKARTEIFLRRDLDIEIANSLSDKSGEQAQELRAMGYTETGDHDNRLPEGDRWKQENPDVASLIRTMLADARLCRRLFICQSYKRTIGVMHLQGVRNER